MRNRGVCKTAQATPGLIIKVSQGEENNYFEMLMVLLMGKKALVYALFLDEIFTQKPFPCNVCAKSHVWTPRQ